MSRALHIALLLVVLGLGFAAGAMAAGAAAPATTTAAYSDRAAANDTMFTAKCFFPALASGSLPCAAPV